MNRFLGVCHWLAIAAVLAVGISLRSWGVGFGVLNWDEAFSWRLTQYAPAELLGRTADDVHPPLYYLVLQAWEGAFGDSAAALRSLSVCSGSVAVVVSFVLCRAAIRDTGMRGGHAIAGGLLAACLLAIADAQIDASRTARMYAFGVALAALSAWILWRALHATSHARWWWAGYAAVVAAFLYAHYYAIFTVVGQGLFALAHQMGLFKSDGKSQEMPSTVHGPLRGLACAAILVTTAYAPWLPTLRSQVRAVKEYLWVPEIDSGRVERTFFHWGTGMVYSGTWVEWLWLALLTGTVVWMVSRRQEAACFFLLPAACPWLLSLAWSFGTSRSIFYERYLVFAQFSLLGYWAVVCSALPGWEMRAVLAVFLVGLGFPETWSKLEQIPDNPPAIQQAAAFLKRSGQKGDAAWTSNPAEVNVLRYYLCRAGMPRFPVFGNAAGFPHVHHLSSLPAEDVIYLPLSREEYPKRIWLAGEDPVLPTDLDIVREHVFESRRSPFIQRAGHVVGDASYRLILCQPRAKAAHAGP